MAAAVLGRMARGRNVQLAADTIAVLAKYNWPGNIRELRNAIEHALAVSAGRTIAPQHLPRDIRRYGLTGAVETEDLTPEAREDLSALYRRWRNE